MPEVSAPGAGATIDDRLKEFVREVCQETDAEPVAMEVKPDHVHPRLGCAPRFGINRLVRSIEGRSSSALRKEFPALKSRLPSLWTDLYFVATVSGTHPAVERCIEKNV